MSTNRNLLKEAIADAKTVKETAIANAKAVLEESFAPQLRSVISLKLQEMAEDDEKEDLEEVGFGKSRAEGDVGFSDMREKALDEDEDEYVEEDLDLNELFGELNEEEEEEESEEEEEESEEEEGEPIDLEDFTDEDLKKMIEDVITDMMQSGELEMGAEEDEVKDEKETMEDEEINLEELLREIDEMEMKDENMVYEDDLEEGAWDYIKKLASGIASSFSKNVQGWDEYQKTPKFIEFAEKYISKEDGTIDPAKLTDPTYKNDVAKLGLHYQNWLIDTYELDSPTARAEANDFKESLGLLVKRGRRSGAAAEFTGGGVKEIQAELEEAYNTIKTLRQDLNEVNLLNAKLLYTNKIFKSKNLNENQKVKVLSSFDKATTVGEVKLVFETLNEGLKVKSTKLNENLGSASKVLNTPKKQPIVESNDMVARFQKLAGII